MGNTSYDRVMHDVDVAVTFGQSTFCRPPEGQACELETGTGSVFTASQAKRHAMRHPGHVVVHRSLRESRYVYVEGV